MCSVISLFFTYMDISPYTSKNQLSSYMLGNYLVQIITMIHGGGGALPLG